MLCRTESIQALLVLSTGETEQSGITCGGTLAVGVDGGRMPAAAAGEGIPDMRTTEEPTIPARATAIRPMEPAHVRAPPRSCFTLPFAPLCAWNQVSSGTVTFRSGRSEGTRS